MDVFLFYAAAGALLWAGSWIMVGYLFADVIALIASANDRFRTPLLIAIVAALIVYIAIKYARRRRFLEHLGEARIDPVELKRRLDAGDPLVIVDLRTKLDLETDAYRIPGALWITPEVLRDPHHQRIPEGSEIVFYCTEPREATSARMALWASSHGWKKLHPLSGGLDGWRRAGFAVEPLPQAGPARVDASRADRTSAPAANTDGEASST